MYRLIYFLIFLINDNNISKPSADYRYVLIDLNTQGNFFREIFHDYCLTQNFF